MKCPICDNETNEDTCSTCGYPMSQDIQMQRFVRSLSLEEVTQY